MYKRQVVVGMYFFARLRGDAANEKSIKEESVRKAEELNALRRIRLNEPITEAAVSYTHLDVYKRQERGRAFFCGV